MAKSERAPAPWQAWTAAVTIMTGAVVGGLGVIFGWPIFWAGVGVVLIGLVAGRVVRLMDFTEEYSLHGERVEPGTRSLHG